MPGGSGWEPQPKAGLLLVVPIGIGLAGTWLVDRSSSAWCSVAGGTPTHYFADLVHVLLVAAAVIVGGVAATVLAVVGQRRRWWRFLAMHALKLALTPVASVVVAVRTERAMRRQARASRPVVVEVTAMDAPAGEVGASRPVDVDVEWLIDGVWTKVPQERHAA